MNDVVRLHRQVYESEYDLEPSFANDLATQLAELARSGWPGHARGYGWRGSTAERSALWR